MNEFQNMPDELQAYKSAEFRMSSDQAFANGIRQIAGRRKKNRERARSSVLSLTSIVLFLTVFYGTPDLQKVDQDQFWASYSYTAEDELLSSIDSSIEGLWTTEETASTTDELLTAIDYDLSGDVVTELNGYDDEVVQKALEKLESIEIF